MAKLVAFTPESATSLTEYVKIQLNAISNAFPELEVEQANELDSRMQYAWYPDRFPAFIIFAEPGVRLAALHAKIGSDELIDWINSNLR